MKIYIIGDKNNDVSRRGMQLCADSLKGHTVEFFQQTSPSTLKEHLLDFPTMSWVYPLNDQFGVDAETGMVMKPYRASDVNKIFACTVSHARLWKKCVELNEEIMILEHDAIFVRKFELFEWDGGVLGLNDPRGATHSAQLFHEKVSVSKGVKNTPWVKPKLDMPQGLAGNSAYIIKPYFAEKLLDKLKQKGGWPNDSIMCKQFFGDELKVVYPYYTRVQGIQSTTTR